MKRAGKRVREVVVAGHGEHRDAERAEEPVRALVLGAAAPVREIAGGDDHLGRDPLDERGERALDLGVLPLAHVEVGDVEDACGHDRMRL